MNCDVCIGVDDVDQPDFYNTSEPRARNPVKCCECGRTVPAGERYHKVVAKWDGVLNTYKQCLQCKEIQQVFACGNSYFLEQLWDDMEQVFGSLRVSSPCFQALSLEAKAFLTEKWWEWKERSKK
jgi:hypothetical protein